MVFSNSDAPKFPKFPVSLSGFFYCSNRAVFKLWPKRFRVYFAALVVKFGYLAPYLLNLADLRFSFCLDFLKLLLMAKSATLFRLCRDFYFIIRSMDWFVQGLVAVEFVGKSPAWLRLCSVLVDCSLALLTTLLADFIFTNFNYLIKPALLSLFPATGRSSSSQAV